VYISNNFFVHFLFELFCGLNSNIKTKGYYNNNTIGIFSRIINIISTVRQFEALVKYSVM